MIHETKFILKLGLPAARPAPQSTLGPSLTLTLVRRPHDAVGRLPGPVVVERRTALAVLAGCVVSADALSVDLLGKRNTFYRRGLDVCEEFFLNCFETFSR